MRTRDEALARLGRVLEEARAAGCDGADAFLAAGRNALTRFAAGAIHQNVAWERETLVLRVARERRVGCVHTDVLTDRDQRQVPACVAAVSVQADIDKEPGVECERLVRQSSVIAA